MVSIQKCMGISRREPMRNNDKQKNENRSKLLTVSAVNHILRPTAPRRVARAPSPRGPGRVRCRGRVVASGGGGPDVGSLLGHGNMWGSFGTGCAPP